MPAPYFSDIFEYPINEFKRHLLKENNHRIVFSGKYGSGKTTFLQDFFKPDHQQLVFGEELYDVYHLYPVNYSVASNGDIMRYIKYDLIIQLLQRVESIDELEMGFLSTLPSFLKKNLHKVAAVIVGMIPKIGKDIVESWEKLDALKEAFFKYHDEQTKSTGDRLVDYLDALQSEEGTLYENDVITKLISSTIAKRKKKSLLIIDDLDRLDPEHIFRILNVFAAHFDQHNDAANKFNFDQVILVCDFRNVRDVFRHKYGQLADFNGYANKFFSSDIYQFDNAAAVAAVVDDLLSSIIWVGGDAQESSGCRRRMESSGFVATVIKLLVDRNFISLRSLIRLHEREIHYHRESIHFGGDVSPVTAFKIWMMVSLRLLRDVLGDYEQFNVALNWLSAIAAYVEHYDRYFHELVLIPYVEQHEFSRNGRFITDQLPKNVQVKYQFRLSRVEPEVQLSQVVTFDNAGNVEQDEPYTPSLSDFWHVLRQAVNRLHAAGYIR